MTEVATAPGDIDTQNLAAPAEAGPAARNGGVSPALPAAEQDHDSGVDENTQAGSDGAANIKKASAAKEGRAPARKITSRSTSRSKSLTKEEEPLKEVKKVPMNKIQVGGGPSPNLKAVKSKIGSLGNTGYKPGGGNVRIEHKKVEIGEVKPKVGAKNEAYQGPAGGQKKVITSHKLNWNAKSKIGSLENKDYKPKGGDKKIETVKLNFKSKAQSKVASTANLKHKPGGGDVKTPEPAQNGSSGDKVEASS